MIGRPRVHHRVTDSTNERAKRLALAGAPHGTLVTAGEQSAGRGRQGRSWAAPPERALLMSIVLRGLEERHALLPLAAAVAVCEACEAVAPVECEIKWPNDVWVDRRKLAGILIEGRPQEGWAVLGIGVNVTTAHEELPPELRETATSLAIEGGAPTGPAPGGGGGAGRAPGGPAGGPVRERLLASLLGSLERLLAAPPGEVLALWRERDALRGAPVAWAEGLGRGAGITEAGALLVETESGVVELDAGEVHLRPA